MFHISVRREFVLKDAMREIRKKKFEPNKKLKVLMIEKQYSYVLM